MTPATTIEPSPVRLANSWRSSAVAAGYLAIAVVTTWPLAARMTDHIAGDGGDPLFLSWVLMWTSGRVLHLLQGDVAAFLQFWQGNIFYPAPLTLAYSEHLAPQMVQALPILAVTHNVVLAYNLLVLATIVVSGVGTYLLVRDLTGRETAAFLAGLAFAFTPYRVDQWPHLEVLSSQWMPLTLYGFRRFCVTGRLRPLVWGTVSLLIQALSCAYYMAYFTPFAAAYCVYELAAHRRLRDRRTWIALVGAGAAALLVIAIFHWPYLQVRRVTDIGRRDLKTVQSFSADTYAFATSADATRLWGGRIRALPRPEGQAFPGFAILALAASAVVLALARAANRARASGRAARWQIAIAWVIGAGLLATAGLFVRLLVTGRQAVSVFGVAIRLDQGPGLWWRVALAVAALLVVSPRFRAFARGVPESTVAFFAWGALAAAWLSLGPTMTARGRPIGLGLYSVYYAWVPGFDGLRVPALHVMIVSLFLAVLAGFGAAALPASRRGRIVAAVAMIAIIAESWSVPVEMYAPPQIVTRGLRAEVQPVYQWVRDLPAGAVIIEFPFGEVPLEIGYTFAAGYHEKPIVNGYSGFFPRAHEEFRHTLGGVPSQAQAWTALMNSGATHAIVHEGLQAKSRLISEWLRAHGAREVAEFDTDRVFQLR